ncbi:MAG: glycoside hydrolase family 16 protein [Phycisphaerae bacterium]|nr:glycoside hydrolase family 16 protein [Phycisphaerae bacterium]
MKATQKINVFLIIAFFLVSIISSSCTTPGNNGQTTLSNIPDQTQWELLWQDEFTGNTLDQTKWARCKRRRSNWNDTMSDDPGLLVINDGVLHLRGIENDNQDKDPAPYLTAGINSKGKYFFKYGKVQIRARFKSAQGAWPALWMMPEKRPKVGYGEIDLMGFMWGQSPCLCHVYELADGEIIIYP